MYMYKYMYMYMTLYTLYAILQTEISVFTAIMLNDHSNPYIESTF